MADCQIAAGEPRFAHALRQSPAPAGGRPAAPARPPHRRRTAPAPCARRPPAPRRRCCTRPATPRPRSAHQGARSARWRASVHAGRDARPMDGNVLGRQIFAGRRAAKGLGAKRVSGRAASAAEQALAHRTAAGADQHRRCGFGRRVGWWPGWTKSGVDQPARPARRRAGRTSPNGSSAVVAVNQHRGRSASRQVVDHPADSGAGRVC